MTEKIRDYNVNGAMIIGVDNGYGNMKTARRCFKTALVKYDSEPVLSRDYLEYEGKFYVIVEVRRNWWRGRSISENSVWNMVFIILSVILSTARIKNERKSCLRNIR